MFCIVVNIICMGMSYETSQNSYQSAFEAINYFFTCVFIVESGLKILSVGIKGYWISGWNKFDFFVVMASIIDIIIANAT